MLSIKVNLKLMRYKSILAALVTLTYIDAFSQITFEKGYFIDDSNNRTECLIRNVDWGSNPSTFEYKIPPGDVVQTATMATVKEFGITNVSKYVRASVRMDRSKDQLDELDYDKDPKFREERLFLKVLVEGQASLFLYREHNLIRFFYSVNGSEIEQLIYKRYSQNSSTFAENNYYKQQLQLKLNCGGMLTSQSALKNIRYTQADLERVVIMYNECNQSTYIRYNPKKKGSLLRLSLRPGFNYAALELRNHYNSFNADFGRHLIFRFGIETEFFLPWNNRKWSIILEPTYQYYRSEREFGDAYIVKYAVDYKSLELPVGLRHSFFLNKNSQIFVNFSYVIVFGQNSEIRESHNSDVYNTIELAPADNFAFGIGYRLMDRYNIELRSNTNRQLSYSPELDIQYRAVSLILGYTFKK